MGMAAPGEPSEQVEGPAYSTLSVTRRGLSSFVGQVPVTGGAADPEVLGDVPAGVTVQPVEGTPFARYRLIEVLAGQR